MPFNIKTKKILSEENCKRIIMLGISLRDELSNMELGLISDYDNTKTYTRGQAVYYNDYLYKCLYTTTGDFDESKWQLIGDDLDLITKADIEAMLGLTQDQLDTLASIILDSEVRLDKTWSSSKIYTDLQQCLNDSKKFTLQEFAKASKASYQVVSATSQMLDKSVIYLMPNSTNYDMYIVESDGTPTKIGDTTIDLSQFYTKTEIDNDFVKKTDADGKYATITTVDGKVDKTSILSTISSNPSDDKLLSEKAINDTFVKKTDITTTIDSSSTDNELPTAKSVWDSLYKICDPQILEDANKPTSRICEANFTTLNTPSKEGLTRAEASLIISINNNETWNGQISISMADPTVYVRSVGSDTTWTKWRRVCTTSVSVADIAETEITTFTDSDVNGKVIYSVKNGICYVTLLGLYSTTVKSNIKVCNLPSATTKPHVPLLSATKGTGQLGVGFLGRDGMFTMNIFIANSGVYTSFSYPIA